jgi:hypothetical protein
MNTFHVALIAEPSVKILYILLPGISIWAPKDHIPSGNSDNWYFVSVLYANPNLLI